MRSLRSKIKEILTLSVMQVAIMVMVLIAIVISAPTGYQNNFLPRSCFQICLIRFISLLLRALAKTQLGSCLFQALKKKKKPSLHPQPLTLYDC